MWKGSAMDLSENERRLLDAAQKNDMDGVKLALNEKDVRVDCLDEYGTSALQLAAFRGHTELCQLLLSHGADVNMNEHEHGYTTLMFAALSGKAELCRVLLEAGAKTYKTNKVNRTASEMAAFTGQHHCVCVINNFLSVDDIEYYTKPRGWNSDARLPSHFTGPLHKLTLTYNIHPVKTIQFLCDNSDLLQHQKQLLFCVEDLMERQMKGREANEVMTFKLHIIRVTLEASFKYLEDAQSDSSKSDKEKLIQLAKSLLATKETNFPMALEHFLRRAIKEFPYHHSILFQTMVRTLAKTEMGAEPSAVSVVNQALIGQRMAADETFCVACGTSPANKRCGSCKMANYCGQECQKLHWFSHKRWCPRLAEQYQQFLLTRRKLAEQASPQPDSSEIPPSDTKSEDERKDEATSASVDN